MLSVKNLQQLQRGQHLQVRSLATYCKASLEYYSIKQMLSRCECVLILTAKYLQAARSGPDIRDEEAESSVAPA
jgi:hypothetical protein